MYTAEELDYTLDEIDTAWEEMNTRYTALVEQNGPWRAEPPRRIMLVIDDYPDFIDTLRDQRPDEVKEIQGKIGQLTRLGRSARIRVGLGTRSRPDVATLPSEARNNLSHQIAITPPVR